MTNKPTLLVVQNPAGTYSLQGRVPAELAYENVDGSPPTERQIDAAKHCGPGFAVPKLRAKTWPSREAATEAARAAGCAINDVDDGNDALIAYLAQNGVTVTMPSTGAIQMGSRIAHIRERALLNGKPQIVISHQSSRGTSYQRFGSRERALKAILSAK